ncbi:ferritin-2 [Quercus suber]|uniref:Ferritin n=1 Tax=Quercus suber TaxID=58331 RepID=A0AAW0L8U2_QUESU
MPTTFSSPQTQPSQTIFISFPLFSSVSLCFSLSLFKIMLLKSVPSCSLLNPHVETLSPLPQPSSFSFSPLNSSAALASSSLLFSPAKKDTNFVVCASKGGANSKPLIGVVFEPFEEVKKELDLVPTVPQLSLARQKYTDECEAAINEQINVEYNVSYVYHAMFAYFDRDNVALKGIAKFFKESSEEERDHAEKFMEYQNKRGGRVRLQSIVMPLSEFDHAEKGDALYAMELALSLEKLTNEKLLNLQSVEAIKKIAEYVAQLRRVGKGHGTWHFDQMLLDEA